MKNSVIFLTLFICSAFSENVSAQNHVATITRMDGDTEIYFNPSKNPSQSKNNSTGTTVLFEGFYYQVKNAKPGDQIQNGNILRTRPSSHANLVFDNGDQINLGPGSSFRIQWKEKNDRKMYMNLMYGRLRGIISKEGPRQKAIIKTRSATMGVRGTDFFISDSGPNGETKITVLRGEVEVRSESTQKIIPVKTGMSALVIANAELKSRPTNKQDFKTIEAASTAISSSSQNPSIEQLEKKALAVTIQDIKTYQPEVYKKIETETKSIASVQQLSSRAISIAAENAPLAPEAKSKAKIHDLKEFDDQEVYDQYFKLNQ